MALFVKLIKENAQLPCKQGTYDELFDVAGYDLYAAESKIIPSGTRELISTGISIQVPKGTYGRIAPRSGLSWKHSIDVGAGVIDRNYRGEVKILLINNGNKDFEVNEGTRVAQLILESIVHANVVAVKDLPETSRGSGGFGSTG